jgi:hypothetical protein
LAEKRLGRNEILWNTPLLGRFSANYPPNVMLPENSKNMEHSILWCFEWVLLYFKMSTVFISSWMLFDRKTPRERRVPMGAV